AVALGAEVIEKHLTLDRRAPGPDHACSCNPEEFRMLVEKVREAETCLGSAVKAPTEVELENLPGMRRRLAARRPLEPGEVLKEADVTLQRPANGLRPALLGELLGRRVMVRIEAGEFLQWEQFDARPESS